MPGQESESSLKAVPSDLQIMVKEENDIWAPVEIAEKGKPWKEKTCMERLKTIVVILGKLCILLALLYLFVCSIGLLSDAFRLLGGKAAGRAFQESKILSNPIADLMMGVLATVLLQSSSTTTSIVVSMVAADLLYVEPAIFVIMGANIGTSVTNTIVSLGQVTDKDQFRRAFAGATVHDCFNWLTVLILLPIEWLSSSYWKSCKSLFNPVTNVTESECQQCGILCQITAKMTQGLGQDDIKETKTELLKVITKPFQSTIIQLDKKIITKIALGELNDDTSIMKRCHEDFFEPSKTHPIICNTTATISSIGQCVQNCWVNITESERTVKCGYLFESRADSWGDTGVGVCLLFFALFLLMACLICIVRLLHSILQGSIAKVIQSFINSDFPGCCRYMTGYVAILLGTGFTMLLQSSSIFTSAITPLVGSGILHLERMYPLTLGANIGTTFTAILAAMASSKIQITMQVALCHLLFNIIGILIWYPVPIMRKVPISMAKALGVKTSKHRWFALAYIILMFLAIPGAIFALSIASWKALLGVLLPIFVLFVIIIIINIMQRKCQSALPAKLRTWDFLPLGCHSLKPYDQCCSKCTGNEPEPRDEQIVWESSSASEVSSPPEKKEQYGGLENPAFTADAAVTNALHSQSRL